jgi:hypothetical protein
MRIDFIAPALDVHSFYAVRAGKRRAVGSIRFRTAPVTCQSERKSR